MPVFDPAIVHECALQSLGRPKPQMFDAFAQALAARYPNTLDFTQPWIYSIAGGAMIQMKLYYASFTEYIMIWGTPIGSEGHSGRHFAGFWDTVIDGEAWYYGEGQFEKSIYRPGDRIYVGPGQARAMNFTNGVWAVEYARGFLPLSLPFGLADEILSCLDFLTVIQTLSLYTDLIYQDIARRIRLLKWPALGISAVAHWLTKKLAPPPPVTEIPTKNIRWL
jgi:hypothetical protein